MTEEQQANAVGHVVVEFDQTRKRIAILRSELARIGDNYDRLAAALKRPPDEGTAARLLEDLANMPASAVVTEHVQEFVAAAKRLTELRATIKELGLNL